MRTISSRPLPLLAATIAILSGLALLLWLFGWTTTTAPFRTPIYGRGRDIVLSNSGIEIELIDGEGVGHRYDANSPFIFIGGFPRSGTTLMRAILDAHSAVRCGQETHMIPSLLDYVPRLNATPYRNDSSRLGLTDSVLDSAVTAFVLQVLVRHGESAARLCDKDPLTMTSAVYIRRLFPRAKFVFMIRDGRASIHSVIERRVKVKDFNASDPVQCLRLWSEYMTKMVNQCTAIGPDACLRVHYESLVLNPRHQMGRVLKFLGLPWEEAVMHHQDFVYRAGGVALSRFEYSTSQVLEPIQTKALEKWVDYFQPEVVKNMSEIAPMLDTLGYSSRANPPDYADLFRSLNSK